MISALPRPMSATVVLLVCVAGAIGAGLLAWWSYPDANVAVPVAIIAGLTGVLAALALVIFQGSPRTVDAGADPGADADGSEPTIPAIRVQPELARPVERRSPAGAVVSRPPLAMQAAATPGPNPGPRHSAAPPMPDGAPQPGLMSPSGGPTAPPADPRAAALLAAHRALLAEHEALLPEYRTLLVQRATLLRGLAELVARLPDESAWQVAKLLEEAGARKVMPEAGDKFDPVRHNVFGTEPTSGAGFHDTVAGTLRPGWQDRDQVLVPANVVLYAFAEHAEGGADYDQQ